MSQFPHEEMSVFLSVLATTPWFENYRENFLKAMPATDHEFLNHYLACILTTVCTSDYSSWKHNMLSSEPCFLMLQLRKEIMLLVIMS